MDTQTVIAACALIGAAVAILDLIGGATSDEQCRKTGRAGRPWKINRL